MTGAAPRLLRHARKDPVMLRQNAVHQTAQGHALVHYPSGAVYSFVPKNASTTLRYSLALANGAIAGPQDMAWLTANTQTFSASLRELATAPYTFTFLRCPHARLASAFLDKIVAKSVAAWHLHRLDGERWDLDTLTFRSFVQLLTRPRLRNGNVHWRPQGDFLVYEDYDDWFGVSDFEAAARRIEARCGLVIEDTRELSRHTSRRFAPAEGIGSADMPLHEIAALQQQGTSPSARALYDPGLVQQVARVYASDLALYQSRLGMDGLLFADASSLGTAP